MLLTRTADPDSDEILACYPVATFKNNRRISHSTEDTRIEEAIRDAYEYFDGRNGWLNRCLVTQSWTMHLSAFSNRIEIPLPPLQSVLSVKYYDLDGVQQTLYDATVSPAVTSSVFHVISNDLFGRLVLAYLQEWPDTYQRDDAVEIAFTAGYGAASAVPRPIKRSIGLLATHLYENPSQTYAEPRLVEVPREIKWGIKSLAGMYRIPNRVAD